MLAVDSSSSDRTCELLAEFGAVVEVIPQAEFGHGSTRNRLARGARGEFLVFLSQDAEPRDASFLAELLAPFSDQRVVGCYARVLPRPDDDPLTRRTVLAAPEAAQGEFVQRAAGGGGVGFNNVASAIRASWFAEHPFPELPFGEDLAWARATLEAGGQIAFAPRSVVWHAHRYGPRAAYERYRIDAAFHREATGTRLRPHLGSLCKGIAYEVREDWRYLAREGVSRRWVWCLRSLCLRTAQVLGQYAGGRGGAR